MTDLHSPTLTNPDMILPYGSPLSATFSSTPRETYRLPIRPRTSGSPNSGDDEEEIMRRGVRRLFGNGVKSRRDDAESALSPHEGRNGNLMHTDSKLLEQNGHRQESSLLASSPTLQVMHDDKSSSIAGSDDVENDYWEGFDGPEIESVMVPNHGSGQESLNGDIGLPEEISTLDPSDQAVRAILDEDENDPSSHAAMSKRAEKILANAKKRLLTMESNLNRARNGLSNRPSSSMSSFAKHDHEPISLYAIPGTRGSPDGLSPAKHRQGTLNFVAAGSKGHSRVFSESSVPSSLHTGARAEEPGAGNTQPSDAQGSSGADSGPGDQGHGTSRNWFWMGLNRNAGSAGRHNNALEPLHEDEPAPASFDSPSHRSSPLSLENQHQTSSDKRSSDTSSLDVEKPAANGLTRARSTTQMRDLRDQMQDLKGKISSLKQRAREDSLRRRSLQSLRTPSPFTAAEQWYAGSPGQQMGNTTVITSNVERKRSLSFGRRKDRDVEPQSLRTLYHSKDAHNGPGGLLDSEASPYQNGPVLVDASDKSHTSIHESMIDDENETDKPNGSSRPLEHHDSPRSSYTLEDGGVHGNSPDHEDTDLSSSPVGERHEDRPDAFDYENFYLHSSMGHYARRGDISRSRSSSQSSIYSVETAKPFNDLAQEFHNANHYDHGSPARPSEDDDHSRFNGHIRQSSGESISTIATFATATEGGRVDDEGEDDDYTNGHPMAGSWQPDYPSKRQFHLDGRNAPPFSKPRPTIDTKQVAAPPHSPIRTAPITPTQSRPRNLLSSPSATSSPLDILSALTGSSPSTDGAPSKALQLGDRDKELVERLIQSLSKVCLQLHAGNVEGSKYEGRVWRRRLDAARRVLDGEVNGEAF